jgi:hypothetical protein
MFQVVLDCHQPFISDYKLSEIVHSPFVGTTPESAVAEVVKARMRNCQNLVGTGHPKMGVFQMKYNAEFGELSLFDETGLEIKWFVIEMYEHNTHKDWAR